MTKTRSVKIRATEDEMIFEAPEKRREIYEELTRGHADTLAKAWSWMVQRYTDKPLLGTRDILKEEDEVQSNGKIFKKLHLGEYRQVIILRLIN